MTGLQQEKQFLEFPACWDSCLIEYHPWNAVRRSCLFIKFIAGLSEDTKAVFHGGAGVSCCSWHILSPVWPCALPLLQWPCSKWPEQWPRWSSQITCATWCSRSSIVTVSDRPNLSQAGRESTQGRKPRAKGLFLPCSLSMDLWWSSCPFGKGIQWFPPCEMWILGGFGVYTLLLFSSHRTPVCCAPLLETSWSGLYLQNPRQMSA